MPDNTPNLKSKPRLAIVIQRYGQELGGGSELHCQMLAERMTRYYDIEILTTCARDHRTWENEYPPGATSVNGVAVRRFPVKRKRDSVGFEKAWQKIFWRSHTPDCEFDLLKHQGPYTPMLIDYLRKFQDQYNAFLFYTYLYYPTAIGL